MFERVLPSFVGRELSRTTSRGKHVVVVVTPSTVATMVDVLEGIFGLLLEHVRDAGRVECIVPVTHKMLSAWCRKHGRATTTPRTLSKWLPLLQEMGVLLYQPGTHSHCSLVAFPDVFRARREDCRSSTAYRLEHGFGLDVARDKTLSKRGCWWRPICAALLDEAHEAHQRAGQLVEHLKAWAVDVAKATAGKAAVVLQRIADRAEREALQGAEKKLEQAVRDRDFWKQQAQKFPAQHHDAQVRQRARITNAERAVLVATKELELEAGKGAVDVIARISALAQRRLSTPEGVAREAVEMVSLPSIQKEETGRGKVRAARAVEPATRPAPSALTTSIQAGPVAARSVDEEAGKGVDVAVDSGQVPVPGEGQGIGLVWAALRSAYDSRKQEQRVNHPQKFEW